MLSDPANGYKLTIGSDEFLNRFFYGNDFAPGQVKSFAVQLVVPIHDEDIITVCANDSETIDFTDLLV